MLPVVPYLWPWAQVPAALSTWTLLHPLARVHASEGPEQTTPLALSSQYNGIWDLVTQGSILETEGDGGPNPSSHYRDRGEILAGDKVLWKSRLLLESEQSHL